jgi:glycosyltransferase involved in cell wall biosynthesis
VVVPSRLENLSLMVLEALACGSPVVAFDIGGMPDMVEPGRNGWLVQPYRVDQLAATIGKGLVESRQSETIRSRCPRYRRDTVPKER